ncbi:Fungalysin metallopeptidase-domain-containing protein [Sparassis latifolia]
MYTPKETDHTDSLDKAKKYINASAMPLFYTLDLVHELYYHHGFDKVSGNIQLHNFGHGSEESDAVIINAWDGSGYNNANFPTPPDEHLKGIILGTHGVGKGFDDDALEPVWSTIAEAGLIGSSIRITVWTARNGVRRTMDMSFL